MNNAPSPLEPVTLEELARAHRSLRAAFNVTLVMLLILTGSLSVFFMREISIARKQITELTRVVVEYEKSGAPVVADLRAKMQAFARSHPEFAPIYARYFGTNAPQGTQEVSSAQPAPSASVPRLPPAK